MESMYELLTNAKKGDRNAREQIILENSGLIWSIVNRFYGRYEQEDLYQIGVIGLIKCIDRFDFSYQVKFSTYAVPMIMGEIRRFLRDDGTIKVSRGLKELSYRAKRMQETILQEENRMVSIGELAVSLGVKKDELILAMESTKEVESLYGSMENGNSNERTALIDQISNAFETDRMIEEISLKEAVGRLTEKEQKVLFLRYYRDLTQAEVARKIGVSQVQVSRMEKKILNQMKESLK